MRRRRPDRTPCWVALALAVALSVPNTARAQDPLARIAVVRPGGGILVADGQSVLPLQVVLQGDHPDLQGIEVGSSDGRVTRTEPISGGGVRFFLAMPSDDAITDLTVDLRFRNGAHRTEVYPLVISPPVPPQLRVRVEPAERDVEDLAPIQVSLSASGEGVGDLAAAVDAGEIVLGPNTGRGQVTARAGRLILPSDLPTDAPSHLQLLAVATSAVGWAAATRGISIIAPVRVRAPIPRGWRLRVEGAETPTPSPRASSTGEAVIEGVRLRYGAEVRVFRTRGRKKRELSIPLPAGRVPVAVVAPLPDQDWADGGTGPTVAVAIPPDPFGGPPAWPNLRVDGARLVAVQERGPGLRVLVLDRPLEARTVRVVLDGLLAGEVQLKPTRGQAIALTADAPAPGERAAAIVTVVDATGVRTSSTRPRLRVVGGGPLSAPSELGRGRWRIAVPAEAAGAPGTMIELVGELDPLPIIVGDALDPPRATVALALAGPAPPQASDADGGRSSDPGVPVELAASLFAGSSFGGLVRGGLAIAAEVGLPWFEPRWGVRLGAEVGYGRREAEIGFDLGPIPSQTEVTGLVLPLELTLAVLRSSAFLLRARAGASLRYEAGALSVDGRPAGGGGGWGVGVRAGLEGELPLDDRWRLTFGALLDGLAADAGGWSSDTAEFSGSLFGARAEAGLRAQWSP